MRCVAQALAELGPEEDAYGTPRIMGFADSQRLVLGMVSKSALMVRSFPLKPGLGYYLSTYGKTEPSKNVLKNFDVKNVQEAAEHVHKKGIFKGFSHAIATIATLIKMASLKLQFIQVAKFSKSIADSFFFTSL